MTTEEHRDRHQTLHRHLDELVADWVRHTGRRASQSTVMELMQWSYEQTLDPTEGGED